MIKPEFLDVCPSQFKNMAGDIVKCDDIPRKHLLHSGVSKGNRYQWHTKDEYVEPLPAPPVNDGPKKIQALDVIDAWELDFYEGSAIDSFAGYKDTHSKEELENTIFYLQRLLERKFPDVV